MHKKTTNILFTIILSFILVPIFAQNGNNPFELSPRLKEQVPQTTTSETVDNTTKNDSLNEEKKTANPFDLNGNASQAIIENTPAQSDPNSNKTATIKQEATNPFDLDRTTNATNKEKDNKPSQEIAVKTVTDTSGEENPFDLKADAPTEAHSSIEKSAKAEDSVTETTPSPKISKTILPTAGNNKSSQQFLFRVVLFMLILLTLLVTLFRSVLVKTYQAFLNDNILSIIYRERGSIFISPYTILYLMFLINSGIFAFLLSEYYQVSLMNSRFLSLISSIGLVFAIFSLKHLILELLAFIFPITKEVKLYNFTIIVFGIIIGILLVPANILIAYAPQTMTSSLVYAAIGLVGLVYLFRSLRGLFIANRFLLFHKFHFLLYICTVEIAPIIIFLKLLQTN